MKKILLLSDTHSYIDDRILEYAQQADEIWHAGDIGDISVTDKLAEIKPLRAVYGNIDDNKARAEFPLNNRFTLEGVDIWITHIGGYPGKYNPAIRKEITENPPKLFICGHSHILKVMPDKQLGLIHMNPGAVGKHGFQKVRTMLRFELNKGKIENLEVIEFKK
ncbi:MULTISPECIES: metallophosphoesterase family protein [unclassified Empedobacter]|uniref:metallophosphoesterase family protein n=1 Tax=unclassified Empedobacter TaxID=2643773 RepID=UPI0025768117|nr:MULTISPECIES: metallophosphoesterase family protein [unclassified Empedobacter]MDM1138387.1 metallophosphoesterase family protein [Empedobacter sp. R132-2]